MKFGDIMIGLQNMGCHNINLVTPTHYVPKILEGLLHAIDNGLNIPIVYNCSGYENVEILELLDGIVDIYMPDIKFMESAPASEYMDASDYPDRVRNAVVVMHKQVGDLECDKNGIAVKGLLIRHLVMPNHGSNTEKVLEFIANEISLNSYVNIMDQYHSMYRAHEYKNLTRRATREEYIHACKFAESLGLYRGFGKRLHE
ncbi:MAG: hypothetical protein A2161_06230 [Candidatus Schekmanbacteria bacterium RBG_13_48_7]|uniref:Pyruvate formate lyase-activating protein n=1 Tax=Candidatus Schekmanbacteria bacterium RBG_13_48_7 TaxID=1817878 RepID=A0A1F7RWZ2_9BACT|nr:MAG: hypothetical protein A2161_06230 [Candidatus Schekmanbacteria bacterium RBG_13_48_7]